MLKHCAAKRKRLFQRCQTLVHTYTTLAFLALLGAPYIYDISSLRIKDTLLYRNPTLVYTTLPDVTGEGKTFRFFCCDKRVAAGGSVAVTTL